MTYERTLSALADPTRRRIFEGLRASPLTVGEIAARQPVSRPAVSQHLRVLEGAGLVAAEPRGTRRYYRLRREGLGELKAWLDGFWTDVLAAYAAHVEVRNGASDDRTDPQGD